MSKITYKSTGVNYDVMDPVKKMAQLAGKRTAKNLSGSGFTEVEESRGESAYVLDAGEYYLAFVEECLGTKSLVADEMERLTGNSYYEGIALDTVAMAVNDLITVGAKPLSILAYWAGGEQWFADTKKTEALVKGWEEACNQSGAVWGGGESPTLANIIEKNASDLAGAAVGIISPKDRLSLGEKLEAGDSIILFASSGIHCNGMSLARKIAEKLPEGYKTMLSSGRMYGDALLDPTIIYAKLVQDIFAAGVGIHYMANITGHGWRKIMRHTKEFTYRLKEICPVPEVLQFIVEKAELDSKEAYGTFNMGGGFAVFVGQQEVEKVLSVAKQHNIAAYNAGVVEKGEKQVVIEPLGVTFSGESLQVRV
ncbi:MAG: AIR synthase-related protein [Candidatus Levyibacteriota bacterium]